MQGGFQICLVGAKKTMMQKRKRRKIIQVKFGDFSVTSYYNSSQSVDGNTTTITMSPDDTGFLPEQFNFVGDETAAYRVTVVDKNGNEIPYKVRNTQNQAPGLAGVADSNGNVTMLTNNVSTGSTSTDFIIKQGESYYIEPNDLQDEFTVTFEKITVEQGTLVTTNVSSAQISEPTEYANGFRPAVEVVEGVEKVDLSAKEKSDYFEDGVLTKKEPVQKPADNNSEQTDNQETGDGKDNLEQNDIETNVKEDESQGGNESQEVETGNSDEYIYEDSIQAGDFTVNTENLASKTEIDGNKTTVTLKDDWAAVEDFEFVGSETAAYKFKVFDKDGNEIAFELVDENGQILPLAAIKKANGDLLMLSQGGEGNKETGVIIDGEGKYRLVPKVGYGQDLSGLTVVIEKVEITEGELVNTDIPSNRVSNSVSYDDGKKPTGDEMPSVEGIEDVEVESEENVEDFVEDGENIFNPTEQDLSFMDKVNQLWENIFNRNDKEDNKENDKGDNSSTGDNNDTEEKTEEQLTEEQKGILETYVMNPFEETICELMLAIGDFIIKILNDIVGEEVTITALVYNQIDAVNPNFFDDSVSGSGITADIKILIEKWYDVLKLIAISVYVLALLAISLHILLASTGNGMSKAKSLLLEWFKAICYLVFIPYLIKYAFMVNDALVEMLREEGGASEYKLGTTFGNPDEWSVEEIEYRSPEYVSRFTGTLAFGSEEATEGYVKKIPDYEQNLDLMRLMRAYAGATLKFVYAVIWYILLGQLIVFIVQYYKRYFIIAFLIVMFPLVCIFYGVSIARGKKGTEMGKWMRELFSNIFTQTVHAIIYTIITGICISVVKADGGSSATINWIIIIVAINFVAEGEKILKKILGAMGDTASGVDNTAQGIKGAYHGAKNTVKSAITGIKPKDN